MDKLKRVLNGNDDTSNDENRGIMGDVGVQFSTVTRYNRLQFDEIQFLNKYVRMDNFKYSFFLD